MGMDSNLDFIAVSESRIYSSNILSADVNIDGYEFLYDSSRPIGKPGGAGLCVITGLHFKVREDLKLQCDESANIWVESIFNNNRVAFGVI